MASLQLLILIIQWVIIGSCAWAIWKLYFRFVVFSEGYYTKISNKARKEGIKEAFKLTIRDVLSFFSLYIMVIVVLVIIPAVTILSRDFIEQVLCGNQGFGNFIWHIPEVTFYVANFYINAIVYGMNIISRLI